MFVHRAFKSDAVEKEERLSKNMYTSKQTKLLDKMNVQIYKSSRKGEHHHLSFKMGDNFPKTAFKMSLHVSDRGAGQEVETVRDVMIERPRAWSTKLWVRKHNFRP